MKLWKQSGILMIATGIIHNAIGFVMGWSVLEGIFRAGFFNSIQHEMDRNAIFWFLFSGFLMMLIGQLMHKYIIHTQSPVPRSSGYILLFLTIIGCIMMPVSGFWLVLPQALIIISAKSNSIVAIS